MASSPFFYRSTTHRQIDYLAQSPRLAIYAGAGVSIDRTGMSWRGLSELLLAESTPGITVTAKEMTTLGQQRIASVAIHRLEKMHGPRTDDRIAHVLRNALYRDTDWVSGSLIDFIYNLMIIRRALDVETEILTTNYDDYIEEAFLPDEMDVIVNGEPLRPASTSAIGRVNYLHGRVPERGSASKVVVSEAQYAETQARVCDTIADAARRSDLLILGSSLTDPPLVRALTATRAEAKAGGLRRYALLPKHGSPVLQSTSGRRLASDGASHLGCEAIFPDYYGQVAQFVHEIAVCSSDRQSYARKIGGTRYVHRLNNWWSDWFTAVHDNIASVQRAHHRQLQDALSELREVLDADPDEGLKLELWIRWNPDDRTMVLWASSVGDWPDIETSRAGRITADSPYVSVQGFCIGHPFVHEVPDKTDRWRTYLASPVRVWQAGVGSHVVGTITLASMRGGSVTSVGLGNRANLRRALTLMNDLGRELVEQPLGLGGSVGL